MSFVFICLLFCSAPTAIQSQVWPVLLAGRDVIAIAQTGSGKVKRQIYSIFKLKYVHDARQN